MDGWTMTDKTIGIQMSHGMRFPTLWHVRPA